MTVALLNNLANAHDKNMLHNVDSEAVVIYSPFPNVRSEDVLVDPVHLRFGAFSAVLLQM